jgi:hypothetical protein
MEKVVNIKLKTLVIFLFCILCVALMLFVIPSPIKTLVLGENSKKGVVTEQSDKNGNSIDTVDWDVKRTTTTVNAEQTTITTIHKDFLNNTPNYVVTTTSKPITTTTSTVVSGTNNTYCYDLLVARQAGTADLQAKVNNLLSQMNSLESDLRARTSGSYITEAQFQRLYATEYQALYAKYQQADSEYKLAKNEYPVCD